MMLSHDLHGTFRYNFRIFQQYFNAFYGQDYISTNNDIALALCCNTNVADYKKEETGCIEFIGYQSDLLPRDFY